MFNFIKSLAVAAVGVVVEAVLPDCLQGVGGADEIGSILSPLAPLASILSTVPKTTKRKSRRKAGKRK
jgi:hypothetical protein